MEIQDGFIVSIFNYCDRWCERCPLTARCRVFAMSAEQEFESDHGPLTEPMVERQAKAMSEHVSRWEKELGVDFAEIQREVEKNPEAYELPDIRFEHLELEIRFLCSLENPSSASRAGGRRATRSGFGCIWLREGRAPRSRAYASGLGTTHHRIICHREGSGAARKYDRMVD
ncbi:MAG: hypothetical protein Q7J25_02180 [Vicinamibacterales bacterium]|nr:hypothetical protein [Vicinamibacterales bacterium]